MWELIDDFCAVDKGDSFRTYASQVGSIGCLVTIIRGSSAMSTTFVPGVKLEKFDSAAKYHQLTPVSGYGEVPTPFA